MHLSRNAVNAVNADIAGEEVRRGRKGFRSGFISI
jgi:hypothetical protein